MKLAAIICEFNPLHTGHKRLLDYAASVADNVLCIMSGNFTQRGLPACADKYSRAAHAVKVGADIVVELPTVFATASAENFAYGGVAIAQKLGADCLIFGSECGDIEQLKACAAATQDDETQLRIKREMSKGMSYPKALASATRLPELDKPNNTLAIEYIKALSRLKCGALPLTIKREDNYNSASPAQYASSAALRNDRELLDKYSFDFVAKDISAEAEENYCRVATAMLSLMSADTLREIEGVTEGLENRILRADKSRGYEEMLTEIKTKRYTRLRLQRIILNAVLNVTTETVLQSKETLPPIRALAVRKSAAFLLSQTDDCADELTTKADDFYAALTGKKAPLRLPVFDF